MSCEQRNNARGRGSGSLLRSALSRCGCGFGWGSALGRSSAFCGSGTRGWGGTGGWCGGPFGSLGACVFLLLLFLLHHELDNADLGQAQDAHRLVPALGFFQLTDALATLHDAAGFHAAAADAKTFIESHFRSRGRWSEGSRRLGRGSKKETIYDKR